MIFPRKHDLERSQEVRQTLKKEEQQPECDR
jgi:hypothetical protein